MLYLYISLGVIAFIFLILFIIYMIVFYAPSKYDYSLPKGEQFEANKELMVFPNLLFVCIFSYTVLRKWRGVHGEKNRNSFLYQYCKL